MQSTQNSPAHRSGNHLLCGNLSARANCVNCNPVGYPPSSRYLQASNSGERAHSSPTTPTSVTMLAPDRSHRSFIPMSTVPSGYYADTTPMYTPNVPRFPDYHHPLSHGGPPTNAYDPFATYQLPPDTPLGFGEIHSEPFTAYQPPTPPAAPEQFTIPNPAFYSYTCRWLGGPECDGLAPGKNREMGEHLRVFHHFIGHERDVVQCEWENCGLAIQRMNVPRHIVSRHLLAAANCRFCKKRFSRPDVVARHEKTCSGISPISSSPISGV